MHSSLPERQGLHEGSLIAKTSLTFDRSRSHSIDTNGILSPPTLMLKAFGSAGF